MDLSYTPEQKIIKESARKFLSKECPGDLIRAMEADDKGFSPELWDKMAELGWLGLIYPMEYEGFGATYFDLIVLLEEMGRVLAPVPFLPTVLLGGLPILYGGTEGQKQKSPTSGRAGGLNILAPQRGSQKKPKTFIAVSPAKAGVQSFS